MAPVVVTVPEPHIWTYQKGNSKVLVLGTVYPEPKGLSYVPASIHRAITQSGAIIGPPWFDFTAHVNLFNILPIWHAARGALYLPDGKHLADVLTPAQLQQWTALKAQYRPGGDVERMRPMYAGWKLYEAVIKHSGVAVESSIGGLIDKDAAKYKLPTVDAMAHWTIKDPKKAARAFQPSDADDLACFQSILDAAPGLSETSRTMARAWAAGDVAAMTEYLGSHQILRACFATATDDAVAKQQGVDSEAEQRKAWLAALGTAAAKYPVVFTSVPVQNIIHPARQIAWLQQEGYVRVDGDAAPTADASTTPSTTTKVTVATPTDAGLGASRH
ncbi:MAG: TraB/GumN family protein [Proteobacteria bacterium]|nr:TraB/GumN family protein [Pseudomonadota bacterium]